MASEDDLARSRAAIGHMESTDNYGITGPATGNDVPLGRYQVMASNLPSWSQGAIGRQVSPQEFLGNSDIQDAVFNHRFGGYLDQYGPEGAARAWFGGPGSLSKNGGARDVLGTSVDGYGKKFMSHFGGNAGVAQPGGDDYEAQGRALALGNGEPQYQAAATSADDGSDGPMASSSGAPGDSLPGMGAGGFDPSAITNDEIQAALGQ
jgi:hypothetical protein